MKKEIKNKIKLQIMTLLYFCQHVSPRAIQLLWNDSRRTSEIIKELQNEKLINKTTIQGIDYKKIDVITPTRKATKKYKEEWDYNKDGFKRFFRFAYMDRNERKNHYKHMVLSEFLSVMFSLNIKIHNALKKTSGYSLFTGKFIKSYISNGNEMKNNTTIINDYKNSSSIAYYFSESYLYSVYYVKKNSKYLYFNREKESRIINQLNKIEDSILPSFINNSNIILLTALKLHNDFLYDYFTMHNKYKNRINPYTKKNYYPKTYLNIENLKEKTYIIPFRKDLNTITTFINYVINGGFRYQYDAFDLRNDFNADVYEYDNRYEYGIFLKQDTKEAILYMPVIELITLREFICEMKKYINKISIHSYIANYDLINGFCKYLIEYNIVNAETEFEFIEI